MNTQQNIDMPAALEAMQTKATAAKSNAVVEPNIDEPAHKSKEADAPNVDTSAPKSITASHDSYVAHMAQLRGQPAFAVPLLVNSSNVVAQYPTMYGVGQSDPSFRAAVKFNGPDAAANLCVRCKDVKCPGLPNCVFESNCFLAQKELTCRACGVRTTRNTDMITRIRSGKYANLYVHMIYTKMQLGEKDSALTFETPESALQFLANRFAREANMLLALEVTAGGGKTNVIIYMAHQLRLLEVPFKVATYNVKIKEELIARGLHADEVMSFHSWGFKVLTGWIEAKLTEDAVMIGSKAKAGHMSSSTVRIKPTVVSIKVRLLVSFYFSDEPRIEAAALVALYRPFVQALVDQARTHNMGAPGFPAVYCTSALDSYVFKYKIATKLLSAWSSVLTLAQKQLVDRKLGEGADARLKFGVHVAGEVLSLCVRTATSLLVNGKSALLNEKNGQSYDLPVIDYPDMVWLVNVLQLDPGKYNLMLDEAQDVSDAEIAMIQTASTGMRLAVLKNVTQAVYQFRGVEPASIAKLVEKAHTYVAATNYRCGDAIVANAQYTVDMLGVDVTLTGATGHVGMVVENATLAAYPFQTKTSSILVLFRKTHDGFAFYKVCLGKGLPVKMHGQPNSVAELEKMMNVVGGDTLAELARNIKVAVRSVALTQMTAEHDLVTGLQASLDSYLELHPHVNPSEPGGVPSFVTYLHEVFSPTDGDPNKGVIAIMSVHAAKGLAADDVYWIQPEFLPLQERLELGGWEEHEELCVAFVAETRAKHRLIKLSHLKLFNRDAILTLWDAPEAAGVKGGGGGGTSSQDTDATLDPDDDVVAPPDQAAVDGALAALALKELPPTKEAVTAAAKAALRTSHPDRHNNAVAAKEKTQDILAARKLLLQVLAAA